VVKDAQKSAVQKNEESAEQKDVESVKENKLLFKVNHE
jgi:hypothetical protein